MSAPAAADVKKNGSAVNHDFLADITDDRPSGTITIRHEGRTFILKGPLAERVRAHRDGCAGSQHALAGFWKGVLAVLPLFTTQKETNDGKGQA